MRAQLARWLSEMAAAIAQDDESFGRQITTTLEQRIAVGLMQARAAECRSLAGDLQISGLIQQHKFIHAMWARLLDRSSDLEQMGLKMCETWPPVIEPEPEQPNLVRPA